MNTINLLILAGIILVLWLAWGSLLFPRVYPITHDTLMDKLERQTLTREESRLALRVILLLPALLIVSWLAWVGGRECSRLVTNFVGLRIFKLPG